MKIRKGFVSNSSSSSFIIGVAKVNDIEKCRKYIEDNKISGEVELSTYKKLKEDNGWTVTIRKNGDVEIESFDCATATIKGENLKDDDYILTYYFAGNEGDGYFYESDDADWGEPNYDRVYEDDFFDKSEGDVIMMLNSGDNAGLDMDNTEWTYGAARNG
jgi:hypothetical protein